MQDEKARKKTYERPAIKYERRMEAVATTCSGPTFKRGGAKDNEGNPCVGTPFS